MSLTIEGYHPNGYDLTDAAWNPVTNTGTIAFGTSQKAAALQGETVAAWNVTNQGTISGGDGGIGVDLLAGGSVSNLASGYIDGYFSVMIQGSAGTVSNDGTIVSTDAAGAGVYLTHGGSVSNLADGRISTNYDGITTDNAIGLVENAGTIAAGDGAGVDLLEGGSATNDAGGMISGTWGIAIQNYMLGSVLNLGTIVGGAESGVYLAGGSVTNEVGGQISGTWGVAITGGLGIVVNAGTIASTAAGESATAVTLKSGFANEVVVDPGAVFIGMVDGGNAVGGDTVSTLELASGLAAGTLSGFGTQFVDFGAIVFDPNAAWLLSGTAAGLSGPEITGFAAGDTIELTGVSATLQGYDLGVLTLATQGGTIDLDVAGNFIAASFQVSDVGGNTDIVLAPVPSVSAATASPNAGQVRTSGEVILTLAMSQAVTVSGGTPTLTLNDGGIATYLSGSGSAALVFGYTVAAGERSADIAITSSSLNGATIENAAGLAADLSGAGAITGGTPQIIGATQVCDLTGNGTSDILFRDAGTGALGDFVMNNSQPTWNAIGWAGTNWEVAGVGDFEGKGTDDILFRDPTSGGMGDFIMTNGQPAWSAIGWAAQPAGRRRGRLQRRRHRRHPAARSHHRRDRRLPHEQRAANMGEHRLGRPEHAGCGSGRLQRRRHLRHPVPRSGHGRAQHVRHAGQPADLEPCRLGVDRLAGRGGGRLQRRRHLRHPVSQCLDRRPRRFPDEQRAADMGAGRMDLDEPAGRRHWRLQRRRYVRHPVPRSDLRRARRVRHARQPADMDPDRRDGAELAGGRVGSGSLIPWLAEGEPR